MKSADILSTLGFSSSPSQNLKRSGEEGSIDVGKKMEHLALKNPSTSTVEEVSLSSPEVQATARESLDFLAALALPLIYAFAFPPVFISLWSWLKSYTLQDRIFPKLAIGLPRGFGKTMVIKLYVLFCILFTSKKFILIISENQNKANNIISDICDALEESNIKKVFGDWRLGLETDRQDLKKFGFRGRNIILMAAGAGTGIRGITLKNERPDILIFDDIQSRECADSQIQSGALETWLIGTAMKAKSPSGCMFIFIANMYPTKWSLLKKLKTNPTWVKFIAGGILESGESLWEELQPIKQLMDELQSDIAMGHPEIFFAEVLNDETATSNFLIDLSKLPPLPYYPNDIPQGNFVIIDPATDKVGADAVSIGYAEVFDGYPSLMAVEEGSFSPGETVRIALEFCLKKNCRIVIVESNAYQYTFKYWFDFICLQKGISGIECVDIYSGQLSKNSRIISMLKGYSTGEIFVDDACKAQVHIQISQWNMLKRDNTDGILDLLTYMPRCLEMYGEYIASSGIIINQESMNIPLLPASANCPF